MSDALPPPPRRRPSRKPRPLDAAIVGMACRFPGARDLAAFWENVLACRSAIGDVPRDRWDPDVFDDPSSNANDRVYCRRGGYLDEPVTFDPTRYGVMPLAVDGGEPEQFLVLDAARAALDDAGLTGGAQAGARVEVVVGRGNYFNRGNLTRLQHGRIVAQTLSILRALHPEWSDEDLEAVRHDLKTSLPPFEAGTVAGQLTNATAGRVSERLDLSGASYVVDAASASSLVALDLGARALAERRADLTIVAGVYLQPDVDFPMVFSRLGALSRSGEARPFAASADGTIPGEGVGVVVLKRLADAERDGDRVYAVVRGVGLASDGRGAGLAAPSARGHARAIRRAYRRAGADPATVGMVEGHGLGVPASDRAELKALRAAFPRPDRGARVLGTLTPLIGHAMPAAGMAGLIKSALALYHRVLPASPHAGDPHPLLSAADAPVALNPETRPWIHGDPLHPRRAGVNAFGFAGANAHAVLEEHAPSADGDTPGCMTRWETEAVLLGARDRNDLVRVAQALLDWLRSGRNSSVPLKDLAYTLNTGQRGFPVRVGLVVGSTDDLRARLEGVVSRLSDPDCRSVRDSRGTYFWAEPLGGPGRLAFLYPGEGAQFPGMLADLCPHFPEVRAELDRVDRVFREEGLDRLAGDILYGGTRAEDPALWAMDSTVGLVISTGLAVGALLRRLGLRPDAVVGHSSGEFLSLEAAGVTRFDRQTEGRLGELGRLFEGLERSGRVPAACLIAVAADRDRVAGALASFGERVQIAIDNCPHQVVIACEPDAAEGAAAGLKAAGMICEKLPFARGHHTPRFRDAIGPVAEFYKALPMAPPEVRLYSCAAGSDAGRDVETIRGLAAGQWALPVNFRRTVEAMHDDGLRLFVEVGARGNLAAYVEDTLRGRPYFAAAVNLPKRSGLTQLNHLVAALYAQGVDLAPEHLYARRRPCRVDLSADLAPPPPGRPLAVGFPEMRLSEDLAERLRSQTRPPAPPPAHRPGLGDDPHPPSANGHANGNPHPNGSANGRLHVNGHKALGTAAGLSPAPSGNGQRPSPEVAHALEPAAPPADADPAMLAYFETMEAFLETQRVVMEAYLGPASGVSPAAPLEPETPPPPPASELVFIEPAEPQSLPACETGGAADTDPAALVLERVSRRTGYPREMLALDLDMEADLGIDSIKRVEILGELHDLGVVSEGVDPERLSRCRTLGQVVEALRRGSGASRTGASGAAAGWAGEVETLVPGRSFVGVLRLDLKTDPVAANHTLGGRKLSALDPDRLGLPVIPFTVMAELLAQAAAVLAPGKTVVGFRDVQAHRWIPYEEDGPTVLEVRAGCDEARAELVHASIVARGGSRGGAPAVQGVVVFADRREPGPEEREDFDIPDARPCRLSAGELYRDQWLFHGPALRAVSEVGDCSRHGIRGALTVLPRRDLFPPSLWPVLHTDPIVLDAFTHLLGTWGVSKQAGEEGDVMFPLRMGELTVHAGEPPEGARVDCRIRVTEVSRHRVRVDADLVGPDGRVWMEIRDWEDWRFYWPDRYRDVFRSPDTVLVGEPVDLPGPGGLVGVWLEPPADMGKPVWRDVLEWIQLGPDERRANRARGGSDAALTLRTWEIIAAKEAGRRVEMARGGSPVYPADWSVEADSEGRPALRSLAEPGRADLPAVASASAEGVAVAVASHDPAARIGVAVERFEGPDREEWPARLLCATRAAGEGAEVVEADESTGRVTLRRPGSGPLVTCGTSRRGEYVWAWALIEGGRP